MGRATKSGSCEGVIEGTSSRRFTKRRRVSQPQARVREETPEEKVDSEEDCQENKEKENEEAGDNDGSISVTLTDHEVLDCPICFEPLSNPVFQCENGHTACSSCCTKLGNKCPSCSLHIGYRNRAIEKVLEASKVICKFAKYGCKETMNYSNKHDHEESCCHIPCLCPLPDCNFVGSSRQLYLHFSNEHKNSATKFFFNSLFHITLKVNEEYLILQEEEDGILFILNSRSTEQLGNVISISCIAPPYIGSYGRYDVLARDELELFTLNFKSLFASKSPKRNDTTCSIGFLLVPSYFFNSSGELKLDVCIWRDLA